MKRETILKTATIRNAVTHDTALLLLRGVTGTVFAFHGAQKIFGAFGGSGIDVFAGYLSSMGVPFPHLSAWLAAGAEFFGGLALLAGVGVGFAAVPLVITMLVACFALRANGFDSQQGGFEFALTLAVITTAIGLLGAGRYTVARGLAWLRAKSEPLQLGSSKPSLH